MKKTLLAAAAVALFGVPVMASAQGKMVFALVPKNMNNPFFDQARDGCKKAEKESGGKIECRYIGPGEHGGGDEQVQGGAGSDHREGQRHRRVAVQCAGHGQGAGARQGGRHSGDDLGLRPAAEGQGAARDLCRHQELRHRREPREDRR